VKSFKKFEKDKKIAPGRVIITLMVGFRCRGGVLGNLGSPVKLIGV